MFAVISVVKSIPTHPLDLYEIAVTDPPRLARFLRALHPGNPRVLGEDFSGAAPLSIAWTQLGPRMRAIAVDLDKQTLAYYGKQPRFTTQARDVMKATAKADIIAATNFPIMYWHTRADLLRYLRHVRTRLNKGGLFVADLYGGAIAHTVCRQQRRITLAPGVVLHYTWDQQVVEEVAARVVNAIHFRLTRRGHPPLIIRNAFTYDWRMWSIPELRDAMLEAGFLTTEVHDTLGGAVDQDGTLYARPLSTDRLDRDWVVYVVARTTGPAKPASTAPQRKKKPR